MGDQAAKLAVVTGGGHGIGRALCRRLSADGFRVVVVDIEAAAAQTVAADIEGIDKCVDVSDAAAMANLIGEIESEQGAIEILISNAGVGYGDGDGGAASAEGGMNPIDDRWAACWNVNVMAQVYAARAVLPFMLQRGHGYIVNVASAAGLLSQIGDAAYSATKHASVGFSESLAITHGDDGIQVSVVCPQAVATRMIGMDDDSDATSGGFGGNEVDGILTAEAVAAVVVEEALAGRFMILPHARVSEYMQRKTSDYDRWIGGMQKFRRSLQK